MEALVVGSPTEVPARLDLANRPKGMMVGLVLTAPTQTTVAVAVAVLGLLAMTLFLGQVVTGAMVLTGKEEAYFIQVVALAVLAKMDLFLAQAVQAAEEMAL